MIPFLIATSLSCSEAQDLVQKMRPYNVEEETKSEMIQIVKDEAPKDCWDANDWRNGAKNPTTLGVKSWHK